MACHQYRIKKSWSLPLATVCIVSLFLLLPAHILYSNYKQTTLDEMGRKALAVANTTVQVLAMESLPYLELCRALQHDRTPYESESFDPMQELLVTIRGNAGVDLLYAKLLDDKGEVLFVLDSSLPHVTDEATKLSPEEGDVFQSAAPLRGGIIKDERWGTSIFAHAPIIDNGDGKILGVVGVAFSMGTFEKSLKNMFFLIIGLFILIIVLVSLAICIVLRLREDSLEVEYLTNLGTKRLFENQLARTAKRAKASTTPFSLLLIDIDGFKQINDTYGHLTGDRILQAVATIIRANVQPSDICSRIGGDEFSIILTSSALEQALYTAQCIQNDIEGHILENHRDLALSVSIGVAQGEKSLSPQDLIELADQALYKAKSQGKNSVAH